MTLKPVPTETSYKAGNIPITSYPLGELIETGPAGPEVRIAVIFRDGRGSHSEPRFYKGDFPITTDNTRYIESAVKSLVEAAFSSERTRREESRAQGAEEERLVGRRAVADDDEIARHAEKQGVSWSDAWRYFEINGYDMSAASPQYDS